MSKYCPICLGEYKNTISRCPKDNVDLLSTKPDLIEHLIDFYAAANDIEAINILAMLKEEDIKAEKYLSSISQFPTIGDYVYLIAVCSNDLEKANNIIKTAQEDGAISKNGIFINHTS